MEAALLNNGHKIPFVGLGTWKSKPGEVKAAVESAIDSGYRHIDCAFAYGNEKEVGEALKNKLGNGLDRKDLFVTSKLWNTKHKAEDVRPALVNTLKDLQLEYLDLYLIHWPIGWKSGDVVFPKDDEGNLQYSEVHYNETWPELEKCVDEGLVRSIGLSNFNSQQVDDVCANNRIKPAVLQVEIHPFLVQNELIAHCKKHDIHVTAYSPLGSGDRPWGKPDEPVLEDKILKGVGDKYNKSVAQVCIRWQIQRGVSAVPKSVNPGRIAQNFDVFDFELTDEDMKTVTACNKPWRSCKPTIVKNGETIERDAHHPHYPFNIPY